MTLLEREVDPAVGNPDAREEALIKEARRLRRRRWIIGSTLAALAVGAGVGSFLVVSGAPSGAHHGASNGSSAPLVVAARTFVPTRSPDLIQPTTLATLPNGSLLILDSSRDQILELKPDGHLSVFAGNGRLGFSGDGRPARDAKLDFAYLSSAGMSVTPDGSVDFLDGNCRIRQVMPDGIIRTLVHVPLIKVGGGPHRTACPAVSVAVSPTGKVYVATITKIDRVSPDGHLVWVAGSNGELVDEPAHPTPSTVVFSPISMTFNQAGDLYIGSFEPRVVYRLTPAGKLANLGGSYPTELATESNGSVLVGTHFGVIQQATSTGTRLRLYYSVNPKRVRGIHWGTDGGFQENGIALTKNGTIYIDNAEGNGYGGGTVLVRISPTKRAALVPIRTSLAATLPRVGAPGFSAALYPAARVSRGATLASCPSDTGLDRFTPIAIANARKIARTYLSSQFASDIAVTDRSWWTSDFNQYAGGDVGGRHTVTGERPTSQSPIASGLAQACGSGLVRDSITVTIGKSAYSDFTGTLYFLDRDGHPVVYDLR